MTSEYAKECEAIAAEQRAEEGVRFCLDDQWYERGNRSPIWFALASRQDGSAGGLAEKLPLSLWPALECIVSARAAIKKATQP